MMNPKNPKLPLFFLNMGQVYIAEGPTVITTDVGGTSGRKILFYAHTGRVLLKEMQDAGMRDL